jgi:hypothetical protein
VTVAVIVSVALAIGPETICESVALKSLQSKLALCDQRGSIRPVLPRRGTAGPLRSCLAGGESPPRRAGPGSELELRPAALVGQGLRGAIVFQGVVH